MFPITSSFPLSTSKITEFFDLKPSSTTLSKSPSVIPIIGILNLYKISDAISVVSSPMVITHDAFLNL